LYLIYELLWYLFVAVLGRIITLKTSIAKYVFNKVDGMISTYEVYVIFQYFAIYFNKVIQDTI